MAMPLRQPCRRGSHLLKQKLLRCKSRWRPRCPLDNGYVDTCQRLIEDDWQPFGRGGNPRCAERMAHCGYQPTAVRATVGSPRQMIRAGVGS